jgi:undecaprenyl diphosphate synthase
MNSIKHLVIIPDGNRRYGKINNFNKKKVYDCGKEKLDNIIDYIYNNYKEVKYISVYGLSYDNLFNRTNDELNIIIELLSYCIDNFNKKYRIRFIVSDKTLLNKDLFVFSEYIIMGRFLPLNVIFEY